ncbi:hypothetical protein FB451DRAFT_1167277 [Mycena latifolia]|nr:hypothetical protein FB451DRAFT_1167277 [Mycena latifolia]
MAPPKRGGKGGKKTGGPRTYAGTTRSMAASEPPEDDIPQNDHAGEPMNAETSSPHSLNWVMPTAEEAWQRSTIFGQLGLGGAHDAWDDFDPNDLERATSPGRASSPAASTGSSPSKRAHSARIAAAKKAKMPVHPPTVPVRPSTPAAPTGRRARQATTPNAAAEKPASKRLRKAATTAPSISIVQAEAAVTPVAHAPARGARRVSFSSRPVAIPTADYDDDSPSRPTTSTATRGQTHIPAQPAHVEEERISVTRAELDELVQKATVAAMAKYSVQDSADTQRSRIRMPSFVDEPVGPTRPATYLRAAAPSSFTAASRMAAPASFGATSRYADDMTDGEDFADLDVVIPTSIRKNIADGIPRMIFLSELTPAKCAAAERERDVDTTVREFVINEKGHVATRQAHTENAAGESSISPADFIIAGDTLGRAIKTYFPNKQQGRRIAAQLDTHLRSMRAEPDFTTHFPRYRQNGGHVCH